MNSTIRRRLAVAGFAASVSICAAPAHAALFNPTCTTTATALNFGNYNPLSGGAVRFNSTISITCTQVFPGGTVNYTIALSQGSGSYATRKLRSGANSLNYNLYTDSTYSAVWGNGSGGSVTVPGSGSLAAGFFASFTNTATVYGQIPALQTTAIPGTYNDTITVTVTY